MHSKAEDVVRVMWWDLCEETTVLAAKHASLTCCCCCVRNQASTRLATIASALVFGLQ
jgi:hypothetical protein